MNLSADYNMTLEEVYITVARRIIASEGDLAILGFANYTAAKFTSILGSRLEDMCSKKQACRMLNGKYSQFGQFKTEWLYLATLRSKAGIQYDVSDTCCNWGLL